VTIDEASIEENQPLLFLDAAYKICRALIIIATRKEEMEELDIESINKELESLSGLVGKFSDLITKTKTINSNSKIIADTLKDLETDMKDRIEGIHRLLSKALIVPSSS
jgi:hypothetical protein